MIEVEDDPALIPTSNILVVVQGYYFL